MTGQIKPEVVSAEASNQVAEIPASVWAAALKKARAEQSARLAALENVAEKAAWSVHALRNGGLPIKLTELEQALSALSPDRTTEETG